MSRRVHLITALLSCVLALVTIWVMLNMATDADASTSGPPRGGCAMAWEHPHSDSADWCREHGWTVHVNGRTDRGVILSPRRVLRYLYLPDCRGGALPCYRVNAPLDFYRGVNGHRHYFWSPTPLRGHPHWQWVPSSVADVLAEGDAPDATTRDWETCAYTHYTHWVVKCPDGYSEDHSMP